MSCHWLLSIPPENMKNLLCSAVFRGIKETIYMKRIKDNQFCKNKCS